MNVGTVMARHIGTPPLSLILNVVLPPWMLTGERLGCLDADPSVFFPYNYSHQNREKIAEAKSLCNSCPVRDLCLEWAVPQTDLDGIWAATTPAERRRIRVEREKQADDSAA